MHRCSSVVHVRPVRVQPVLLSYLRVRGCVGVGARVLLLWICLWIAEVLFVDYSCSYTTICGLLGYCLQITVTVTVPVT